ncbi:MULTISPECIES: LacI family DNA-binding transcriptional regulator [Paenibacillus]|uniref:LacI family DNA-binding transcriptional regulator n=1 Tax=Paenibacillus TaxID=44249 RepID=UPI00041F4083|nr:MULTISPECIES: LacI family DNA-binding transcriptional regulator [Paenibacillus]KEO77860.1 LacI family transcriptional regulator [Paenibacillus polymyxa]MCH6188869.1 LacI family transcriptional regulator [Paenibacillus polymyxa]UMY53800.1 LacI family transcriptional regulator [Paenibacillus peoriae]WRL58231.1 LacI family DNA-binding transcriptional regulator [Paenibacillus polymyxa]
MANIHEIAKLAGVSSATVSRVINNHPYVSEPTRQRVQEVIDRLDYVPNLNAVSLKKGMTKLIGIISLSFNDSLGLFVRGFTMYAQEHGFNIALFITNGEKGRELEALEMLRRKQLDALVCMIRVNEWSVIEHYTKYGSIVTWQRVNIEAVPSVFMDQYQGYTLALEHLYTRGYRKIVNVYGSMRGLNTKERIRAYHDFCEKYDLDAGAFPHFYDLNSIEAGEQIAHWWAERAPTDRPDAFACSTDYLAAGLLTEARRLGVSVPSDFAVVGFDNTEISHLLDLTTIHYPIDKQAENAFIMIRNALEGLDETIHHLEFKLVERATT